MSLVTVDTHDARSACRSGTHRTIQQVPLRLPESALLQPSADTGTMLAHSGLILRAEHSDDLEPLTELLVVVDAGWGDVPFRYAVRAGGLPAARDVIRRPKIDSVVAEIDGEVVGYCALRETDGAVMAVNGLVAPNMQGRGIGTAMLAELCTRALARGSHVHGEVLLDSHASYQMCRKLGFREYGRFNGKVSGRDGRLLCLAPDGVPSCATSAAVAD